MIRSAILSLTAILPALAQIPAFPGAEGFGAYAKGGRGGDVYYVTNLNNNGSGSLRVGLNTAPAEGRTIVFAVSGYIPVVSDTNFNVPANVTIAGQTAPGDGVGLRGGRMLISGSDVVMRHFRIRHGKNGTGGDCLNIASTAQNTMLDHISLMFSTDENFSFFNSSVNNFTMQYSNSTWGMERHNAGGLWDLQNGSCHHTLWAHHRTRNPKARPSMLEWINNVTFHWRNEGFIMGDSQTPANWKANVRGCYYISIDDADDGSVVKENGLTKAKVASNGVPNFSLYLDDTLYDYNDNGVLDGTDRGYDIVSGSEFASGDAVGANRYYKSTIPFPGATGAAAVQIDDPLTAYKKVISSASPLRLDANYSGRIRDELDTLLVETVVNQESILVQKDGKVSGEDPARSNNGEQLLADQYGITNHGFGTLNGTTPPTDVDLDGMPDIWEITLNGLNGISYNVAADDHNTVFSSGQLADSFLPPGTALGYTYLEEYLHFLAVPHATMAKHTADAPSVQSIDLRKYTSGFSVAPSFTISAVANGTAQQFLENGTTPSPDGPIVKFTPITNTTGRAGFDFTVTDAEGSQWSQQFAILVSSAAAPRDLVWVGNGSDNLWDGSSFLWQNSTGAATSFDVGDTALFDDRGSATPAINLSGSLTPGSVLFTGGKNYTLGGSGSLSSTGTLTKAGDTTLTISAATSFALGASLNGGTTNINSGYSLSGGPIRFSGGSTLNINSGTHYFTLNPNIHVDTGATGNINLSQRAELNGSLSGGGTFNIFSPSTLGAEGRVYFDGASAGCTGNVNLSGGASSPGNGGRVAFRANGGAFNGFGNARVNLEGIDLFTTNNSSGNTYAIGTLNGDENSRLRSNYLNGGGATTWLVGGLDEEALFAGEIMDGITSISHFDKSGSGTLTLSGNSTHSGNTTVSEGILEVTGSLANASLFVNSGAELKGSGVLGHTLVVRNGGVLSGDLTIGDLTTLEPGATVSPSAQDISTAGGLSINSSTLVFDLSDSPNGDNDRVHVTGGQADLAGTNDFQIRFKDGVLGAGTYKLIDCDPAVSLNRVGSMNMTLTTEAPPGTRQSFSINRTSSGMAGGYVWLQVTNDAEDLTWTGNSGNDWNLNSAANFSNGETFYHLDAVTLDDSTSAGNITLTGELQPRALKVMNSSTSYAFTGTGLLAGPMTLTKSGSGNLTLGNTSANTYSGGTVVSAGTLVLENTTVGLGSGTLQLAGGTLQLPSSSTFLDNSILVTADSAIISPNGGNSTVVDSYSSTLASAGFPTLDISGVAGILSIKGSMSAYSGTIDWGNGSGMLRLNSGTQASSDLNFGSPTAHFALGSNGGTLANRNGDATIYLGALSGGPGTYLTGRQSGSGDTSTTYIIGAIVGDLTFDGAIHHGGDLEGVNLIKEGVSNLTLGGNSDFVGSLLVRDGSFLAISGSTRCSGDAVLESNASLTLIDGVLGAEDFHIGATASVQGTGTIEAEIVNDGFIIAESGPITLAGDVINNGEIRVSNGHRLTATGSFVNNGLLDLRTSYGDLPSNLENNGTVIVSEGFKLTNFTIGETDVTVTVQTYTGHDYLLEWSTDMSEDSWMQVGTTVSGDGSEKTFTHSGGAAASVRFYRIKAAP